MQRSIWKEWLAWLMPVLFFYSALGVFFLPYVIGLRARESPRAFFVFAPLWVVTLGVWRGPLDAAMMAGFVLLGYLLTKVSTPAWVSIVCGASFGLVGAFLSLQTFFPDQFFARLWFEEVSSRLSQLGPEEVPGWEWFQEKSATERVKVLAQLAVGWGAALLSFMLSINAFFYAAATHIRGSFYAFRLQEGWIWVFILVAALCFMPGQEWLVPGFTGLALLLPFYLLQGVAISASYLRQKGLPLFWQTGLVLGFTCFCYPIVLTLGFFDLWFDFRRLDGISD